MAMSFEESLLAICKEIIPDVTEFSSYNADAMEIRNFLMEEMKKHDDFFKASFNGLSLTETCTDCLRLEIPDEFELYIKLKMAIPLTPVEDTSCSGFVILKAFEETSHPLIRKQRLSRQLLQDWIRSILFKVIGDDGVHLPINGRTYRIKYPTYGRGYGVVHTILAHEIAGKREISFDFIPAFEFPPFEWPLKKRTFNANDNSSWFAAPFGGRLHSDKDRSNEFAFMACDTQCQHYKQNFIYSLRLMKAILDVKNLELVTNFMLKSICLEQLKLRPNEFGEQQIGAILIELFEALIHALRHKYLPFFLDKRFKRLSQLRRELSYAYPIQMNLILKNLRSYQRKTRVNYADVAAFSVARNNRSRRWSAN